MGGWGEGVQTGEALFGGSLTRLVGAYKVL